MTVPGHSRRWSSPVGRVVGALLALAMLVPVQRVLRACGLSPD